MAPTIEVSDDFCDKQNKSPHDLKRDFIYVPSTGLYVAKERTLSGESWFDVHKQLQSEGSRMPTIPEFTEFLKYLRDNPSDENTRIYKDITEVRDPWRAEWLDADFKVKDIKLHINYNNIIDPNGNLVPENSDLLDEDTLIENGVYRISLESWLDNPTSQGLPRKDIDKGELYYWTPDIYQYSSVAGFFTVSVKGVGLNCYWTPSSNGKVDVGVRAVKRE
tara:strand:- start:7488 stop:8147 length:660 start_codon:yes stop_codon:yes gene_type:complete